MSKRDALFLGGIWAAVLVLLLWNVGPLIAFSGDEVTDYAANSVLIQSAKRLTLTLGNYSRVGFHHPGPAFLYVLAAGEWLFHDRLGVASPVGGQLLAATVAEAAWLCGAAFALRSLGLSRLESAAALAATAAALACTAPLAFSSLWFPNLYVLPFTCFVLSLAGALAGSGACWPLAAGAAGFLVNGHVSFAGICGVMVLVALGAGVVEGARRPASGARMWSAVAVFAFFLLPLAWREFHHRPGPVEQYLDFARANPGHGLSDAAATVERQWLRSPIGAALAFAGQCAVCVRAGDRGLRAPLICLAAASGAAVYYATTGIDDLAQDYTLIWYLTVPALSVGLGLVAALRAAPRRLRPAALASAVVGAGLMWSAQARPALDPNYNSPDLAALNTALSRLGPVAIDLDRAGAYWTTTWPIVVGLEAYQLRRGGTTFCVDRGWHLVFSEAARCGPADAGRPHVLIDVPQQGREPDAVVGPLAVYRE